MQLLGKIVNLIFYLKLNKKLWHISYLASHPKIFISDLIIMISSCGFSYPQEMFLFAWLPPTTPVPLLLQCYLPGTVEKVCFLDINLRRVSQATQDLCTNYTFLWPLLFFSCKHFSDHYIFKSALNILIKATIVLSLSVFNPLNLLVSIL